jgi:hypothetical protein
VAFIVSMKHVGWEDGVDATEVPFVLYRSKVSTRDTRIDPLVPLVDTRLV